MSVFTEPKRMRNCSLDICPVIVEPITAPWLAPSPGKRAHIGETRIVARVGFTMSSFEIGIFSVFWGGIFVFVFIE